jgi:nitrate reductase gamma subunit
MQSLFNFVSGPMVWIAFLVFLGGSLYKVIGMLVLTNKKEKFIFSYMSWKYSLRSIIRWITPFGTVNMRMHPVMTIVTFVFHLSLFVVPIFLFAHIILLDEAWGLGWSSIPNIAGDVMTLVVIGGCLFFLVRRFILPEVKYVTSMSDFVILAIVAAPFATGFFAYHQWFNYQWMMILHMVSGEVMLMAIPFTRLAHMLFAPFTRAYMGSEFGAVRNAVDY